MSKRIDLEDAVFRLEMLTDTLIALEEAVESSENELPRGFLYLPVKELQCINDKLKENLL